MALACPENLKTSSPLDYGLYTTGKDTLIFYHSKPCDFNTGDPALYFFFHPVPPFSRMEISRFTPSLIQQALDRDRQCVFLVLWIFPLFVGYKASAQHFEPESY